MISLNLKSPHTLIFTLLLSLFVCAHEGHSPALPNQNGHLVFRNNTIHLHTNFEKPPTVGTESILLIQARNGSDHTILDLKENIEVELWMPSMGHGSAPTQVERVLDAQGNPLPGAYRVRNIYFIMGGDWDVRITLTDKKGTVESQILNLSFPETHKH